MSCSPTARKSPLTPNGENGATTNGEPTDENGSQTSPTSNNVFGTGENLVLMEAYSLGCPACAQYHTILKQIRQEYADQITFQAVHFPLTINFANARAGHRAVEAAAQQDKFWEMHDILFERRELWTAQHGNEQPIPQIELFAEELGLDLEQFRQDFRSAEINNVINEDEAFLKNLGVTSTPTFFINGRRIASTKLASVEAAKQTLNAALGTEEPAEDGAETNQGTETDTQTPDNDQTGDAGTTL